jgi:hypothetical protein
MQKIVLASLIILPLLFVSGNEAQKSSSTETSVWAMETVKLQPEELGPALSYLDHTWMRFRAEAKQEGAILSYHRFVEEALIRLGEKHATRTIVLLTQYKNQASYDAREKLLADRGEQFYNNTPGIFRPNPPEALLRSINTTVFQEVPGAGDTEFKLLAKQ